MVNKKILAIYKSSRPKQWVKNLLVFIAPLLSLKLDYFVWLNSIASFICFCLISSSIYLLNDSLDVNEDKLHPIKKFRPIAAGSISIKFARLCSLIFLIISFSFSLLISNYLFLILIFYTSIQIMYCLKFKNKVLIDLFCISSGFLLRTIAGSSASKIYLSPWFLLTIGMLAFFLAVEKRKAELIQFQNTGKITRKVLRNYSLELLVQMEGLSSTTVFLAYSLWAFGPEFQGAPTKNMLFTIPFVLFGILRYQLISNPNKINEDFYKNSKFTSQNPEEVLFKDKGIIISVSLWLISTIIILFKFG